MEGRTDDGEGISPPQEGAINSGPGSPGHYSEGAAPDAPTREASPHAGSEDYEPPPPRKGTRAARPCRVPGCAADVTGLKSYNWRYRICEEHRSAPSVVIDGMRVRFCQMCAKFHELAAFQGRKMSCQKKLDGHNARRRIGNRGGGPDGGSRRSERVAGRSSSGGSSSLNLGGMGGPGDSAHGHGPLGLVNEGQSLGALGAVLAQAARQLATAQPPTVAQWPGIAPAQPPPAAPTSQSAADMLVSLLRMAAGPGPMMGAGGAPPLAPAVPSPAPPMSLPMLEAQALLQTLESIMAGQGRAAQPSAAAAPAAPAPGVAAPVAVRLGAAADGALGPILAAVLGETAPATAVPSSPSADGAAHGSEAPSADATADAAATATAVEPAAAAEVAIKAEGPSEGGTKETPAPDGGAQGGNEGEGSAAAVPLPPPALPAAQLVRLSIKLFGCEPHQLEPSVHRDLLTLVSAEAEQLEAYVRPGCTAVTLDLRVPLPPEGGASQPSQPSFPERPSLTGARRPQKRSWEAGVSCATTTSLASEATVEPALLLPEYALQAVHALLGARRGEAGSAPAPFVVQVGGRVAVGLGGGAAASAVVTGSSRGLAPALLSPEPHAVVAGRATAVTLRGRGIAAPTDLPLCRQRGSNVTLDVLGAGEGSGGLEWVTLRPLGLTPGCAELEVERGALLSEAVPLLVLPDSVEGEAAAAEVCAALSTTTAEGDRFVREVGWALQQCAAATSALEDVAAELRATEMAALAEARGCPVLAALLRQRAPFP